MSLLNDALRKRTNEDKGKEPGFIDRRHFVKQHVNGRKISRIFGLPLLLGSLVFGGWYFWGTLSAQIDSPIAASNISKDINVNKSNHIAELNKDHIEEIAPEPEMLKPLGEITPTEDSAETDTIKKIDPPTKSQPEKVTPPLTQKVAKEIRKAKPASPPPTREAEKKPFRVKKKVPRNSPKTKSEPVSSQQEARFLQKAIRYHRQGKFNQAIQMYRQVLRVKPDHRDALFNLASAYIQLKAYSEALPLLKKLRRYDHGNPEVLVNLAIVEIGMGNSAEAIDLLDLAAKQYEEPKFEICFHRAAALSRLGRLEEALRSYKKAEELNPKHPTLNFNLAVLCDKLHKYNEAVNYYGVFVQQSDNLPQDEEKKIESRVRSLRAYLAGNQS